MAKSSRSKRVKQNHAVLRSRHLAKHEGRLRTAVKMDRHKLKVHFLDSRMLKTLENEDVLKETTTFKPLEYDEKEVKIQNEHGNYPKWYSMKEIRALKKKKKAVKRKIANK